MSELDKWFPRDRPPSGPAGPLTKEERVPPAQEHAPTQIKKLGEKWTRDYLGKIFGIYTEKRSDAPVELPSGDTLYPKRGVDYFGSVPSLQGFSLHLEMEVKAFSGDSFSLSNIKEHQAKALSKAANRYDIAMISLVRVIGGQVDTMWWIPWAQGYPDNPEPQLMVDWDNPGRGSWVHTFAWVMRELRGRTSGNFKAKSIREQDFDLLEEFAIRKEGRVWKAVSGHWLAAVTGKYERVMLPKLL